MVQKLLFLTGSRVVEGKPGSPAPGLEAKSSGKKRSVYLPWVGFLISRNFTIPLRHLDDATIHSS